jgi:hypothetical protein
MLPWPGNSWVYWAVSAAAVFFLLRVFVYSDRFSPKSRRACLTLVVGAAASIIIVGVTPGIVDAASTAPTNPEWWINPALWLGGTLTAAAAIFLLAWALFADRSRGRRRCPRCWYDMSATTGLKCPECGREQRRERRLFRTRRRKWLATLAVVLMLAGTVGAAAPRAKNTNWEEATPDWIVLLMLPFVQDGRMPPQSFGDRVCSIAGRRIGSWNLRTDTPTLCEQLLAGHTPQWKRWLSIQSASLAAREEASGSAQQLAVNLAGALKADAASLAIPLEGLCRQGRNSEIRIGALERLADVPTEAPRAMSVARDIALDNNPALRSAAAWAMGVIGSHGDPTTPPAELLQLVLDAEPTVQFAAIRSLGSFVATDQSVRLLEDQLTTQSRKKLNTFDFSIQLPKYALETLVHTRPESRVAKSAAMSFLRSDSFSDVRFTANIMASEVWIDDDLLNALAATLDSRCTTWVIRIILDNFAKAPSLSPDQSVDVLAHFAISSPVRSYVAEAFAFLGPRGRDVLPRLHELAAEWDTTDPDAAARLRKSINVIEGKAPATESE